MFGPFGVSEIVFIFFLALIIFGPKKLPEIGKTLGKGMREFKKATDDLKSNWEDHLRDAESPLNDLKQTIHDVKADVETSTGEIHNDVASVHTDVQAAASLEHPEEKKE